MAITVYGAGAIGGVTGAALVLAMPLTERLLAMIEDLESGRRRMSWTNLDELVAAFRATR
ncbi:MAG: hypothetical protein DMD96_23625 [Candidatus Rokuibacteriota bacterium]|nr:MAG: hypothetical protein DMD96_23625 [Candidatus Rokubacteria bacterium]